MTEPVDPLSEALRKLPHGPEFRFLDRLVSLDPGRSGVGAYHVRGDESFLCGHFPDDAMVPGVILIEAAAQLAGVVAQSDPTLPPLIGLKLTAVRAARILGTARPGQTLQIAAEIEARLANVVQARVQVGVEGRTVLVAEVALGAASASTMLAAEDRGAPVSALHTPAPG